MHYPAFFGFFSSIFQYLYAYIGAQNGWNANVSYFWNHFGHFWTLITQKNTRSYTEVQVIILCGVNQLDLFSFFHLGHFLLTFCDILTHYILLTPPQPFLTLKYVSSYFFEHLLLKFITILFFHIYMYYFSDIIEIIRY